MKITKIAASRASIPVSNSRSWNVPTDARLIQHIYMINESSPRRKDYIIRTVAFPVDGTNNICMVTMSYWGGSIDANGSPTPVGSRSFQVKQVDVYDQRSTPSTHWYARNLVDEKSREYDVVTNLTFSYGDNRMANSVDVLFRGAQNNLPRQQQSSSPYTPSRPNAPTAPTPSGQSSTPPPPPPPREDPSKKLKDVIIQGLRTNIERIQNNDEKAIKSFVDLVALVQNQSLSEQINYKMLFDPEVLPLMSQFVNDGIMNGFLIFKAAPVPMPILEKMGISPEAKQKLQDFINPEGFDEGDSLRSFSSRR